MMVLIGATSVVGMAVFLERLFHLHRAQIHARDFLEGIFTVLRSGNLAEAVSLCDEAPGPVARIVRAALLHYDDDPADLRRAIEEAGLAEIPRLEHRVPLVRTVAHAAPAMGLLGTVLGMARLLLVLQQQGPLVHAGDLAGGLRQALVTTAAGLAVAIAARVGYDLLVARVEAILLDMERASGEIAGYLARERSRLRETRT